MKHTSITISGSKLHSTIEVSDEEYYFLKNFIYSRLETEGKDSTALMPKRFVLHQVGAYLIVETIHTNLDIVEAAYNTHIQYAQAIQQEIQIHLGKFESQRPHWENSLKMTLNACGLVSDDEGGEL